ncbi:MAG TPA: hypothetical protein VH352_10470, partial [Pseudonocardiaceae bacterium]|nr:hypothetical protein [Pseudonocardiaceae bacterium]
MDKLDRLLGGIILTSAVVTGPASWALIDPKGESLPLMRTLLDRAKRRVLGTSGYERHELFAAAHTVLAVSSFFDTVETTLGPNRALLKFADEDKLRLAGTQEAYGIVGKLLELRIPLPWASDAHYKLP